MSKIMECFKLDTHSESLCSCKWNTVIGDGWELGNVVYLCYQCLLLPAVFNIS